MNIVTINGQTVSTYDAILWAAKQFGENAFEVKHCFPNFNWQFDFKDPKHATHFALRWA